MSTFKLKVSKKNSTLTEFNFSIKKILNYLITMEDIDKVVVFNPTDYTQSEPLITIDSNFKIVK
jgi:polyisoprenoid-binding protein YceI